MSIKYSIFNTDCSSIISYNIEILIIFFIKILFKLVYIAALFRAYITSHDIVAAMNEYPKKCSFVAQCIGIGNWSIFFINHVTLYHLQGSTLSDIQMRLFNCSNSKIALQFTTLRSLHLCFILLHCNAMCSLLDCCIVF